VALCPFCACWAELEWHQGPGVAASGRVLRYVAEAGGVPLVPGTFGSAAWRRAMS
jgi:hypothetical protein